MNKGLFLAGGCEVGSIRGGLCRTPLFFYLCQGVGKGFDILSLLRGASSCLGFPRSYDKGTIPTDVPELAAGVTFSILLSDLGLVDLSIIFQVVVG